MNTIKKALALLTTALTAVSLVAPTLAEEPKPNDAEMMAKMMALAQPGENHKLLQGMVGTWSYTVKMWMDPKAGPSESTGTAVRKSIMDGRYVIGDHSGKFKMPGADGKMKEMNFKGMSIDGYDNVQKKFISAWVDNMGTGIMLSNGTYDAGTKTFTYNSEVEMMPGKKTNVRAVMKMVDADHHSFEWYEDRGGQEEKTMEITYTRKK
jgi:hypothetical protein